MCAERHRRSQPVHALRQAVNSRWSDPRQRRPDDRVCYCYVDTAERSNGAGWLIVDVDWQVATSATGVQQLTRYPGAFILQTPTDHDSQLVL